MRKIYLFVAVWGVAGLVLGSWLAQDASGQNFAGTVGAEENLSAGQEFAGRAGADLKGGVDEPFALSGTDAEPLAEEGAQAPQEDSPAGDAGIPDFVRFLSHYTLGVNDVVEISVLRHPEVSGQYVINNEGSLQYEFIGDVPVEGKTKDEVKTILEERLTPFIISPEVTVKIVGYNSKIVYVIGEVGAPGKIFMRGDTITVREALVQAGLPLLSAKAGDSRVITPSADGNPKVRKVNVAKLLYKGDLREDLVMNPGDTLYIPPTFLAKTMRVLQPISAPIGTAAGTGRTVMTGF